MACTGFAFRWTDSHVKECVSSTRWTWCIGEGSVRSNV